MGLKHLRSNSIWLFICLFAGELRSFNRYFAVTYSSNMTGDSILLYSPFSALNAFMEDIGLRKWAAWSGF